MSAVMWADHRSYSRANASSQLRVTGTSSRRPRSGPGSPLFSARQLRERGAQLFGALQLLDLALVRERDVAGLFAHHDDDRIGLFAEAERGAVARAVGGGDGGILGERQHASG